MHMCTKTLTSIALALTFHCRVSPLEGQVPEATSTLCSGEAFVSSYVPVVMEGRNLLQLVYTQTSCTCNTVVNTQPIYTHHTHTHRHTHTPHTHSEVGLNSGVVGSTSSLLLLAMSW